MFDVAIYPDLLRIASRYTIGRNFDNVDLVHEIYLQDYNYTLSDNKLFSSLKNLTQNELSSFVSFRVRQRLPEREHICKDCKEQLPASAFYVFKDKKINSTYIFSSCIECYKKAASKYRDQNKEQVKKIHAAYRKKNKKKVKAAHKAYYEANKEAIIAKRRARKMNKDC